MCFLEAFLDVCKAAVGLLPLGIKGVVLDDLEKEKISVLFLLAFMKNITQLKIKDLLVIVIVLFAEMYTLIGCE